MNDILSHETGLLVNEISLMEAPGGSEARPSMDLRVAGQSLTVDLRDIEWIEAADYYAQIHTRDRSLLYRKSLARLEQELPSEMFLRIHRNAIVNKLSVKALRWRARRDLAAVLASGIEVKVARSRIKRITRQFPYLEPTFSPTI